VLELLGAPSAVVASSYEHHGGFRLRTLSV